MIYLSNSEEITGYKVKIWNRDPFKVVGYTLIVPPGKRGEGAEPAFWNSVIADGRLDKLKSASSVQTWVLGLGSWDPECEKDGRRYTICIEETEHTNFSKLREEYPDLLIKEIGASEWMCFEMTNTRYSDLWKDNPYKMMVDLGYQFHTRPGDYSVGLHFDADPPDFHHEKNPAMEFWITVVQQ